MFRLAVLGLVLSGVLLACGDDDDTADTTTTAAGGAPSSADAVTIADFAFEPEELTVATGATVRWVNTDDAEHSIESTADALAFESERLAQDAGFEQTFEEAGEYSYVCGIHNFMSGTITVEG
jgi:plastocyanin